MIFFSAWETATKTERCRHHRHARRSQGAIHPFWPFCGSFHRIRNRPPVGKPAALQWKNTVHAQLTFTVLRYAKLCFNLLAQVPPADPVWFSPNQRHGFARRIDLPARASGHLKEPYIGDSTQSAALDERAVQWRQ